MTHQGGAGGPPSSGGEPSPGSDSVPPSDPLERLMRLAHPAPLEGGPPSFFRNRACAPPTAAPGSFAFGQVVGDFELIDRLGQGGMGQVWLARQRSLARTVAVKFIRPERVTEHQLELFAREARAGGRLSHPGIVTIFGHGHSDGLAWIAMEYVEGAWTLKDFLDEAARAVEVPTGYDARVARFVAEIAEAMQTAHDAGVIHRDLKPQNVLITSDDRPKVTDFGLARIVDETALSITGEFAGTYFYMSPEQVAAKRMGIDHRTDVFSLGIVLYELLALRRPFEGDTSHQVAAQIVTKDPPDLRSVRSRVPRDLAVIAAKALEKDRDKRFLSMGAFAADLRRHLANEPIHARPPTSLERAVKWSKRHPAASLAAAIVTVTFTVIAFLFAANVRTTRALSEERTNLAQANQALDTKSAESEQRRLTAEENARLAHEEKVRADWEAAEARAARDDVMRVSAPLRLNDLVADADRLWPAHPENIPAFEAWLARAEALAAELPAYEQELAEQSARVHGSEAREPGLVSAPPQAPAPEALGGQGEEAFVRSPPAFLDGAAPAFSAERASEPLELELGAEPELVPEWEFVSEEDRGWHTQLKALVRGLRALGEETMGLSSDGVSPEYGWGVKKRLTTARQLQADFDEGGQHARAWAAVLPEIRAAYPGLDLMPQFGLVPLGPDPHSKLWEFAHVETGIPARRGVDGKLAFGEETGLVFVLLPGGRIRMGAQGKEPQAAHYDQKTAPGEGPVHGVTLSPFFLSKYEMTQGQWERFLGRNPSNYRPSGGPTPSSLHPVEQVNWFDCMEAMERLGLRLPSEAEWEYGARGGTSSVWWTGDLRDSLRAAANLADQSAARAGATWETVKDWPEYDDGFWMHAPVDGFRANPFGLHHVHGNVWEWCLDAYVFDAYDSLSARDPVAPASTSSHRSARGGSFFDAAYSARSACRAGYTASFASDFLGLRPARSVAGLRKSLGPVLVGDARLEGSTIRLTDSAPQKTGGVWWPDKVELAQGFLVDVEIRIAHPGGLLDFRGNAGGDGFALVIQDHGPEALGLGAGYLGYEGLVRCCAVEFDVWDNAPFNDPHGDHISVNTRGSAPNTVHHSASVAVAPLPNLADGAPHLLRLAYLPSGGLLLYLDDLRQPLLRANLDLQTRLGARLGKAWVGITASTGATFQSHEILRWSVRPLQ